jgi:hypothetical protein
MSLAEWERNGWLTPHHTSPQEISELLAIVQRDLQDSRARDVSADYLCRYKDACVGQLFRAAPGRAEALPYIYSLHVRSGSRVCADGASNRIDELSNSSFGA